MKQSQADLYMETYQVLDLEMSRLREIQQWQSSAASKVCVHITVLLRIFFVYIYVHHLESIILSWCS